MGPVGSNLKPMDMKDLTGQLHMEYKDSFCIIGIAAYDKYLFFLSDQEKLLILESKYTSNDSFEYEKSSMRIPQVRFKQICSGDNHVLALDTDGNVYGLGSNLQMQLGFPGKSKIDVFTKMENVGPNVLKILAVKNSSFFVNSSSIKTIGEIIGVHEKNENISSPQTIVATGEGVKLESLVLTLYDVEKFVKEKKVEEFSKSRIFKMDMNDSLPNVITNLYEQIKSLKSRLDDAIFIKNAFEEELCDSKERVYAMIEKNKQKGDMKASEFSNESNPKEKKKDVDEFTINSRLGKSIEDSKARKKILVRHSIILNLELFGLF